MPSLQEWPGPGSRVHSDQLGHRLHAPLPGPRPVGTGSQSWPGFDSAPGETPRFRRDCSYFQNDRSGER